MAYSEQLKERIRASWSSYLQPDKSGKGFICPVCGSGSGKSGTGITHPKGDNEHFTCWRAGGCFSNADLIDIITIKRGLADKNTLDTVPFTERLEAAADELGIDLTPYREGREPYSQQQRSSGAQTPPASQSKAQAAKPVKEKELEPDFSEFIEEAAQHISETEYHRGISEGTLRRFKVGFCAEWRHPKAGGNVPTSPRLIIPTSLNSYIARDTRTNVSQDQERFKKSKAGKVHTFNRIALYTSDQPVFVVEGEIDALSVIDVGGAAVSLGSTSSIKRFCAEVEASKPTQPMILSLDNDVLSAEDIAAGKKAAGAAAEAELAEKLRKLGIPFYRKSISGQWKDANEALMANREAFKRMVDQAVEEVLAEAEADLEAEREELQREAAAYHLPSFLNDIVKSKTASCTSTGFPALDKNLDGGIYAGLYIVGAISSLGKTTFCLQIADQLAAQGKDVLIFSLEMARNELIAKSISRLTLQLDLQRHSSTAHAKTTRGILTGSRYEHYSREEGDLIQAAIRAYSEYAQHIYITEGVGDVGVKQIREKVERHIRITGRAPVVLIDYLQIIAPADIRATDKQNTDKAVLELKRLSRDYSLPIIGISSFNRDNYQEPVNMASFKESGAIEYSSDVLIGLQYAGMDYDESDKGEKERRKRIRDLIDKNITAAKSGEGQKVQIKILKNRNGGKGDSLITFYPMFNFFTEGNQTDEPASRSEITRGRFGSGKKAKSKGKDVGEGFTQVSIKTPFDE